MYRGARIILILAALPLMMCCSGPSPGIVLDCGEGLNEYFRYDFKTGTPAIRGRVRVETPQYRVRGVFRVEERGGNRYRVDFKQSGMLGAGSEEATIYIEDGIMTIFDRKRERFYDNDSSLTILSRATGMNVVPGDILYMLLLKPPPFCRADSSEFMVYDGEWELEADWRGRYIHIEGENVGRPSLFRQCRKENGICYTTGYGYRREYGEEGYPRRIRIEREDGKVVVSLDITDVKKKNTAEQR